MTRTGAPQRLARIEMATLRQQALDAARQCDDMAVRVDRILGLTAFGLVFTDRELLLDEAYTYALKVTDPAARSDLLVKVFRAAGGITSP
ncbi:hypothetical protein FRAHR75_770022 [Frankia sp. Hr75.2]|nr:hypothetical protein FRAHR75_770022 [Frankia sp. Hr75.2]